MSIELYNSYETGFYANRLLVLSPEAAFSDLISFKNEDGTPDNSAINRQVVFKFGATSLPLTLTSDPSEKKLDLPFAITSVMDRGVLFAWTFLDVTLGVLDPQLIGDGRTFVKTRC